MRPQAIVSSYLNSPTPIGGQAMPDNHLSRRYLAAEEHALGIGVQEAILFCFGIIQKPHPLVVARVIHQRIEPIIAIDNKTSKPSNRVDIRNIQLMIDAIAPSLSISATSDSNSPNVRLPIANFAPDRKTSHAIVLPIPRPAPVTATTFPSKLSLDKTRIAS